MVPNPFRLRVQNAPGQQERIIIKSPHEIELMRRAGKITAEARALAGSLVRPGVTTSPLTGK